MPRSMLALKAALAAFIILSESPQKETSNINSIKILVILRTLHKDSMEQLFRSLEELYPNELFHKVYPHASI